MSFFNRTFLNVFISFALVFSLGMLYTRDYLKESILAEMSKHVLTETYLMAKLYDNLEISQAQEIIEERTQSIRISLINIHGDLLADSHVNEDDFSPANNYDDRPEIQQAKSKGKGVDIRIDDITQKLSVFAAARLNNGNFIRLSVPSTGFLAFSHNALNALAIIISLSLILALFIAYSISKPLKHDLMQVMDTIGAIARGKYQRRLRTLSNKEFNPIAEMVNHMATQVAEHIRATAEQKEQLQSILDTMNEGVLVLGSKGGIRRCNKALRGMFPQLEHANGKQVVEIIPVPSLHQAIENILNEPAENGHTPSIGPLQLDLGFERMFSVHLTKAGSNTLNLGAVIVFHDITAMMRLERVRSDFVANVSHELRTPLTAIQGYAETLTELDDLPETSRRFAEIIRKNGVYLATMVEELLSLARLESGDVPMHISKVQALESINAAIGLCRRQFEMQEIKIIMPMTNNLIVMANTQHLTQIFRNLLENAGRYAPKGGKVHIEAMQDPTDTSMTRFAICDNGPGIPTPDKSRIFERFYRVEKHRSQSSTGLGLAICKHTLERFGGRIWVESPTNEYSTVFYFTIPTAPGDEQ